MIDATTTGILRIKAFNAAGVNPSDIA